MESFNHLYLEIEDLTDAGRVKQGVSEILDKEVRKNPFTCTLNFSTQGMVLHADLNTQGYLNGQRASKVFKSIAEYVRRTRALGTYEIEPYVGLLNLVKREVKRAFPFTR